MPKVRERNEIEYLRGVIKKLKNENSQLKKQVKQQEKRKHLYEDLAEKEQEAEMIEIQQHHEDEATIDHNKCTQCQNGAVSMIDVGTFRITICSSCKNRTRRRIGQEIL